MASDHFKVTVIAKAKHGYLRDAMDSRGWSQAELGRFLGLCPQEIGRLLNLKWVPSQRWMTPEREQKLFDLTGKLPEELWPEWVTTESLKPLVAERSTSYAITPLQLEAAGVYASFPAPDEHLTRAELSNGVRDVLTSLTPREELILRRRYFDEDTLVEVAAEFGISTERVRQIEAKALRKMRHPSRMKRLQPFITADGG